MKIGNIQITDFIILFGGALSILMSVAQIVRPNKKFGNWFFSLVFFATGLFMLYFYYHFSIDKFDYTFRFAPVIFILLFSTGPVHYASGYKILIEEIKIRKIHLLHFLPAAAASLAALLDSTGIIHCRVEGLQNAGWEINIIQYGLIIAWLVHLLSYEITVIVQFFYTRRLKDIHRNMYPVLFSIIYLIIVLSLMIISQIFLMFEFAKITIALLTIIVIVWYLFTYLYPDTYPSLNLAIGRYSPAHTKGLDRQSLKKKLMNLMDNEKIFCDEDLTLHRLSSILSVTPHQLSEFLNREIAMSFSRFINHHRIEEAMRLLVAEGTRSIDSIALAVGFNSKSVFYNSFLKHTGASPQKYRKQNTGNNS